MFWISVKDKLPPIGNVVLLYQTYPEGSMFNFRADPLNRNFTRLGGMRYDGQFISYENQYGDPLNYVSHWTHIPAPPKEK